MPPVAFRCCAISSAEFLDVSRSRPSKPSFSFSTSGSTVSTFFFASFLPFFFPDSIASVSAAVFGPRRARMAASKISRIFLPSAHFMRPSFIAYISCEMGKQ